MCLIRDTKAHSLGGFKLPLLRKMIPWQVVYYRKYGVPYELEESLICMVLLEKSGSKGFFPWFSKAGINYRNFNSHTDTF